MDKRFHIIYILGAAAYAVLATCACQRIEENVNIGDNTGSLALRTQYPSFDIETTKAEETVMVDSIFAYPFNETTASAVTPIVQDSRTDDGIYYFTVPADASDILFTNVSEHSEWLEVRSAMPDTLLSITTAGTQGTGQDILFGGLADYSGAPEESIALTRAVARLRTVLKIIVGTDTVSNVQGYFDNLNTTITGVASGISFGHDFSFSYSGSSSISSGLNITSTSCHSDYIYTFPTLDATPTLELYTEITGSGNTTFRTALPSPVDAGKDYTITIYLHKDNTEAGFSIGEVTFEDTFTYGSFNDSDRQPFELIQFSAEALMFPAASNISREVVVTSKLGNWTMTLPSEALSSYSVENLTSGEAVSAVRPSITGNSGDTLRFTTLRDISGNSSSSYIEVSFQAEKDNNYILPLLQSNGHQQSIAFNTNSSGTIEFAGYCSLYEIDGQDSTLLYTSTGDSYAIYLNSGEHVLTGDHIVKARLQNVSSITMDGCSSLMDFNLERSSIQELDLSTLTALKNLTITNAANLGSLDLSGSPLVSLELDALTILNAISAGDNGLQRLETVSINNCNQLTQLSLSGSTLLKSVSLDYASSIADINLAGCTSLETIEVSPTNSYSPLASLNISGCTSLNKALLRIGNGSTIESLDFSGCPSLKELSVQSNSSSDNNNLRYINLDGCTELNDVYLYYLKKLKRFEAPGTNLEELTIYRSDSLATLDISSNTRLNSVNLDYCYAMETVNLSGCRMLKSIPGNIFRSSLTFLDISHSGIEDLSINNVDVSNLETLNVDSSALRTFYYYSYNSNNNIQSDTLDFSGCSVLDSVYISNYNDENMPLATLVLDGCNSIRSLRIYGLPHFSGITLENGAIDRFYLDNCINITQLNLNGYNIRNLYLGQSSRCTQLAMLTLENSSVESLVIGSESMTQTTHDMLSRLSLDGSSSLRKLDIIRCPQLYLLNMDGCTNLESVKIWNNTNAILPSLDLSGYPELKNLTLRYLPYINRLDLRKNSKIENIELSQMSNINTVNCENLVALSSVILDNSVPSDSLNLSNCAAIETLTLNCSSRLKEFVCSGMTGLTNLNISSSLLSGDLSFEFPSLERFTFNSNNNVTSFVLAKNNRLREAYIDRNTKLTLSSCNLNAEESLSYLSLCYNSNYSDATNDTLDLSGYYALDTLSMISSNGVVSLNLQGCSDLKLINLDYTDISGLDIEGCSSLIQADLYHCNLDAAALETFYGQLPSREISELATYRVSMNPGAETADASIALEKNWIPTTNNIAQDLE